MRGKITLLLCAASLFAQEPPLQKYHMGKLLSINNNPTIPKYEYTIWDGGDDAFTGASPTPISIRLNHKVKFYVNEPHFVYIIDESGQVHKTQYVGQALIHKRRWFQ
jgi:hypothetical protein